MHRRGRALLLILAFSALAGAGGARADVLLHADFDHDRVGLPIGTGGAAFAQPVHVDTSVIAVVRADPGLTPSLMILDRSSSAAGAVRFEFPGGREVSKGVLAFSATLRFPIVDEYSVLVREAHTSTRRFMNLRFHRNGVISADDARGFAGLLGRYEAGRPIRLTAVFDLDEDRYDVHLDGCLVLSGRANGVENAGIGAVLFAMAWDRDLTGVLLVDDVSVTTGPVSLPDECPPALTCPGDVTVEATSAGGTRRSDSRLEPFFASVSAPDDRGGRVRISNDAPAFFALGKNRVTFEASDPTGNVARCTAAVTVEDTEPPEISVRLNRDCLWPPNQSMSNVVAMVRVSDQCDRRPTYRLLSITSDEPDSGDGTRGRDIRTAGAGLGDRLFELRAERDPGGDGRAYAVVFEASDASGNTATDTVHVTVPLDRYRAAFAATGFTADGTDLEPDAPMYSMVIRSTPTFNVRWIANVQVGNTEETIAPTQWAFTDVDGDGLDDLQVYFDAKATRELRARGLHIALRCQTRRGTGYLEPDIFALRKGEPAPLAQGTAVRPPQPNPFTATTEIQYVVDDSAGAQVEIVVRDDTGRHVRTLVNGAVTSGPHAAVWDGRDENGQRVPPGVYTYAAELDGRRFSGRVLFMR